VEEQTLRAGRRGAQCRPFLTRAQIRPRGYSRPLERALTDFGADEAFGDAVKKVREHYGVEVDRTASRRITLIHARAIGQVQHERPTEAAQTVTSQLDGSMIPMVLPGGNPDVEAAENPPPDPGADLAAPGIEVLVDRPNPEPPGAGVPEKKQPDKRKIRELYWREARLCCARAEGKVQAIYGATLSTIHVAGALWREVTEKAGMGPQTYVHGLGDGEPCIVKEFAEQFGPQGKFTVDFWHVSQNLAPSAEVIAAGDPNGWLHQQKGRLLDNNVAAILAELKLHLEPEVPTVPTQAKEKKEKKEKPPVRKAYGYLDERKDYLDYKGARAKGLEIGSGRVEAGHRHVLQARLKISGAWWLERTAEWMLQLRVVRANEDWDKYWALAA
jgi:hypothetical protein